MTITVSHIFKPWVVCLTDVDDVDSCIFCYDEHSRCITEIENTNAYFVMIGIGVNVCYDLLSKFSGTICPIKIDENNLVSFRLIGSKCLLFASSKYRKRRDVCAKMEDPH